MNEIICESLMKTAQIFGEIWAHLFLEINLKIAKLPYQLYRYFCTVEHVALTYHPAKFGNNCKTQSGNMDKSVRKPLTGGENFASSLWLGLDGELLVEVSFMLIRKEIAT